MGTAHAVPMPSHYVVAWPRYGSTQAMSSDPAIMPSEGRLAPPPYVRDQPDVLIVVSLAYRRPCTAAMYGF